MAAVASVAAFGFGAATVEAATISSATTGNGSANNPYYSQGLTLGSGGDWNNISFAFDRNSGAGFTAYAAGDLFILTANYSGTPAALSSSTSGYLAQSNGISNGFWTFDSSVTLQSSSTYYFVMGDRANASSTRIYGVFNNSAPGLGVSSGANSAYFGNNNDFDHILRGEVVPPSTVPLPAGMPLLIGGMLALGLLKRRRGA